MKPDATAQRATEIDRAVRQATWKVSAFGHPAELRRIWNACLARDSVSDDMYRWAVSYWRAPA